MLDFVIFEQRERNKLIKCVIWDLDNTIWDGTISEQEEIKELKAGVLEAICFFDKMGIIQSISSKNDKSLAEELLRKFDIYKYFVSTSINWNRKSEGINETVKSLNIGMDSVVFIDDSSYERAEVLENCKGIRVYDENSVEVLKGIIKKSGNWNSGKSQRAISVGRREKTSKRKQWT